MAWHYEPICAVYQYVNHLRWLKGSLMNARCRFIRLIIGGVVGYELAKDKIEEVAGVKIFERE